MFASVSLNLTVSTTRSQYIITINMCCQINEICLQPLHCFYYLYRHFEIFWITAFIGKPRNFQNITAKYIIINNIIYKCRMLLKSRLHVISVNIAILWKYLQLEFVTKAEESNHIKHLLAVNFNPYLVWNSWTRSITKDDRKIVSSFYRSIPDSCDALKQSYHIFKNRVWRLYVGWNCSDLPFQPW